jgi:hypothetical protein
MASKFTDTDIWNEDWFCDMPGEYQLFTKYIFDKCDNAGVWKPNKFDFETKTKFKVSPDLLFKKMNAGGGGHDRVLLLDNGRWFITGYILFQWFNKKKTFDLVLSNRLHKSLYGILIENKIDLKKVRGLKEVLETSMVMVMDNINLKEEKKEEEFIGEKQPKIRPPEKQSFKNDLIPWVNLLKQDVAMREKFVRSNYLESEYDNATEDFDALAKGEGHKSYSDYRKHFFNWMNGYYKTIEAKSKARQLNVGNNRSAMLTPEQLKQRYEQSLRGE